MRNQDTLYIKSGTWKVFTENWPDDKNLWQESRTLISLSKNQRNLRQTYLNQDCLEKNILHFKGQSGHFAVYIFTMKPWIIKNFAPTPQKLKNTPTYQSTSGCAEPKSAPDLPKRPVNLFQQSIKICYNNLEKYCWNVKKIGVHYFVPDLGWKMSELVKTVEI